MTRTLSGSGSFNQIVAVSSGKDETSSSGNSSSDSSISNSDGGTASHRREDERKDGSGGDEGGYPSDERPKRQQVDVTTVDDLHCLGNLDCGDTSKSGVNGGDSIGCARLARSLSSQKQGGNVPLEGGVPLSTTIAAATKSAVGVTTNAGREGASITGSRAQAEATAHGRSKTTTSSTSGEAVANGPDNTVPYASDPPVGGVEGGATRREERDGCAGSNMLTADDVNRQGPSHVSAGTVATSGSAAAAAATTAVVAKKPPEPAHHQTLPYASGIRMSRAKSGAAEDESVWGNKSSAFQSKVSRIFETHVATIVPIEPSKTFYHAPRLEG